MSDENKGRSLTPEEEVAAARRKKIQNFKLQINDFGFGDNTASGSAKPSEQARAESVGEILQKVHSEVDGTNGSGRSKSEPPVYVAPDADGERDNANRNLDDRLNDLMREIEQKNSETDINSESLDEEETDDSVISSYSDEELKRKMNLADEESLKAYKKMVKKRCKKKAKRNGCMFKLVWLVMVVFVAVLLGMFLIRGTNDMLAINRGAAPTTAETNGAGNPTPNSAQNKQKAVVDIPANATLDQVTDILVDKGVIKEPLFFKLYASLTKSGEPFLEGSWQMDTDMDYEAILNFLIYNSGPKETVSVRFTEGMSARQIAHLLQENGVCSMDKFLEACNSDDYDEDYEFLRNITNAKERYYKLEGYLFPDTYTFFVNDSVDNVIEKFLDNFNKKICIETRKFSGYSEEMTIAEFAEYQNMSIDYVLNMASLVQAEAADEHDMYNIASIFYNRLSTEATGGMTPYGDYDVNRLKSDVTVYYPYQSKNDVPKNIREKFVSTYDTYEIEGLPPGPVCNPGEKAIIAALQPASTNYYFFCHKVATDTESAVAYYAVTYDQQVANEIEAGLRKAE